MESLKDSMSVLGAQRTPSLGPSVVRARDIMTKRVLTLKAGQSLVSAVARLVAAKVSGAPVLDDEGKLAGILSEYDCMKILANESFHHEGRDTTQTVGDLMTPLLHRIEPQTDLFAMASLFITHRVRRLPVVANEKLLGIVSRRDVLRAISRIYR